MNDKDRVIAYEVQIEDMLHAFQERIDELESNLSQLSEFEQGRLLAFTEVTDIIKTRYDIIHEVLSMD